MGCVASGTQSWGSGGGHKNHPPPSTVPCPRPCGWPGRNVPIQRARQGLQGGTPACPPPESRGNAAPPVHCRPPRGRQPPAAAASRGAEGRVVPAASRTAHTQRQGALPAPLLSPPSARRSFIKRKHKPEAEGSTFKLLAALPVYELRGLALFMGQEKMLIS